MCISTTDFIFNHLSITKSAEYVVNVRDTGKLLGAANEGRDEDDFRGVGRGRPCDRLASRAVTQPAFTRWHERIGGSRKVSVRSVISGMGASPRFPCVSLSRTDNICWIICDWR